MACTGQPKLIIILFCDLENIVRLVLETGEKGGGGGVLGGVGARGLQKQIERERERERERDRDRDRERERESVLGKEIRVGIVFKKVL